MLLFFHALALKYSSAIAFFFFHFEIIYNTFGVKVLLHLIYQLLGLL